MSAAIAQISSFNRVVFREYPLHTHDASGTRREFDKIDAGRAARDSRRDFVTQSVGTLFALR